MLLSVSVISVVSIICFPGCVADSFNDTTILSVALLLNGELSGRSLANIEQNHCCRRHLTQKHADFTRATWLFSSFDTIFIQCFQGDKKVKLFNRQPTPVMQIPEIFCSGKQNLVTAVTNALSCSRPRLLVGPVPLTTAPVPSATKRARHERHS